MGAKIKNILLKVLNIISIVVIVLAVVFLVIAILNKRSGSIPNIFGYSSFRVLTGSMEPEYPTGTMVITKETPAADVQTGDVISFYSLDPDLQGSVNTHRVIEKNIEDGKIVFTTKGDANVNQDDYPVPEEMLIGKVVGQSEFFGKISVMLANPMVFFPIIIIPLAIIFIINIKDTVKLSKKLQKQEEEENLEKVVEALKKSKENAEKAAAKAAESENAQPEPVDKPQNGGEEFQ